MSQFTPFDVRGRGGRRYPVTSLSDAREEANRMLDHQYDPELATIVDMIKQAMAGHLCPRVAFEAFEGYAKRKGLLERRTKSAAWAAFAQDAGIG